VYNPGRFHRKEGDADMISAETKSVIDRAKQIYANQLQADLESRHMDRFVAIEPDSGEYFLGNTFDEAVKSARMKYPSRLSHTIRIGHCAAFHIGVAQL
jgi:hypothetical protein